MVSKNHNGILVPEWMEYTPKKEQRNRAVTASVDLVLPRFDLKRKDKYPNTAWKGEKNDN